MQPYQPSNRVPLIGLTLLIVATLIGSFVVGYLVHFVGKLIYLIILFPLIAGAAGGYIIHYAIKTGKVRNPAVALIFGLLTGLLIYGIYIHAEYQSFAKDVYQDILNDPKIDTEFKQNLTPVAAADLVTKYRTNTTGLWGYINYLVKNGIKLSSTRRSGRPITLNPFFSWLYFGVELLIYTILAGIIAMSAAKKPFCEQCETWYREARPIGSASVQLQEALIAAVKSHNFKKAGELLRESGDMTPRVDLSVSECPNCVNNDVVLSISEITLGPKNEVKSKELLQGMVEASCVAEIQSGIKNA